MKSVFLTRYLQGILLGVDSQYTCHSLMNAVTNKSFDNQFFVWYSLSLRITRIQT